MTALAQITSLNPAVVYEHLDAIYSAYDKGSVITRDQSISVFAELCKAGYAQTVQPILISHLANCRPKEVPQHIERISVCINATNVNEYKAVVKSRFAELSRSQQARVNKVFKGY